MRTLILALLNFLDVFPTHEVRKNDRHIVAFYVVPFPSARRKVRKLVFVISGFVEFQSLEEKQEKFFIFEAGGKVLNSRVVEKKLSVVVDEVEIFPALFICLALLVRERTNRKGEGGGGGGG